MSRYWVYLTLAVALAWACTMGRTAERQDESGRNSKEQATFPKKLPSTSFRSPVGSKPNILLITVDTVRADRLGEGQLEVALNDSCF